MASPTDIFIEYCNHFKNEGIESHLIYQWYLIETQVLQAWMKFGRGSEEIVIAVIDLEFDINHPDLKNKLHMPLDMDLGKKFIIRDKNFHITTPFQKVSTRTHGTNVASVALAEKNNSGIVGIAPNARLMPIRAFGLDENTWIEAIQYAIDNGAHIFCSSIGFLDSTTKMSQNLKRKIKKFSEEIIMCFASGNLGQETIEISSHPDVIGVGACNIYNELTSYSNTADNIVIVAPSDEKGLRIIAADDVGSGGESPINLTFDFGGTSAASPIVAGIIALMLSHNKDLKTHEVKKILHETGQKLLNDNKHVKVNALRAIQKSIVAAHPV